MVNKIFLFTVIVVIVGSSSISCSDDIPECNEFCAYVGGWQLVEAYADNAEIDADLSLYRLMLLSPQSLPAQTSQFTRVGTDGGEDGGTWRIDGTGNQSLVLQSTTSAETEIWAIDRFSPRQLVIHIDRDISIKEGPAKIQLVLEPF